MKAGPSWSASNAPWSGSRAAGRHLPQSLLGIAMDYALGQWRTLEVYLDDGRVEIDNNLVENAIRPTALGKKNWLFIGDADAGERGAIIYTIIESCRRRGIDPYAYLKDVLTRLPTHDQPSNPRSHAGSLGQSAGCNCNGKPHHKRHSISAMTLTTPPGKLCQEALGGTLTLKATLHTISDITAASWKDLRVQKLWVIRRVIPESGHTSGNTLMRRDGAVEAVRSARRVCIHKGEGR